MYRHILGDKVGNEKRRQRRKKEYIVFEWEGGLLVYNYFVLSTVTMLSFPHAMGINIEQLLRVKLL